MFQVGTCLLVCVVSLAGLRLLEGAGINLQKVLFMYFDKDGNGAVSEHEMRSRLDDYKTRVAFPISDEEVKELVKRMFKVLGEIEGEEPKELNRKDFKEISRLVFGKPPKSDEGEATAADVGEVETQEATPEDDETAPAEEEPNSAKTRTISAPSEG